MNMDTTMVYIVITGSSVIAFLIGILIGYLVNKRRTENHRYDHIDTASWLQNDRGEVYCSKCNNLIGVGSTEVFDDIIESENYCSMCGRLMVQPDKHTVVKTSDGQNYCRNHEEFAFLKVPEGTRYVTLDRNECYSSFRSVDDIFTTLIDLVGYDINSAHTDTYDENGYRITLRRAGSPNGNTLSRRNDLFAEVLAPNNLTTVFRAHHSMSTIEVYCFRDGKWVDEVRDIAAKEKQRRFQKELKDQLKEQQEINLRFQPYYGDGG